MSIKPMSDKRQELLVKCAEDTIGLMNVGVSPDAALLKVAKDAELNSHEVELVSHAINNSKTLSHLANSAPEDKEKPFPLTNAKLVNENLYDSDPVTCDEADKEKKDIEKAEEAPAGQVLDRNKKEAAVLSRVDSGWYLDGEPEDHLQLAKTAFGTDESRQISTRVQVTFDPETCKTNVETIKTASAGSALEDRFSHNPYDGLSRLVQLAEEAGVAAYAAEEQARLGFDKLAFELRRLDAPKFARIEALAKLAGVSEEVLDLVYGMGALDKIGQERAGQLKVASQTSREAELVDMILRTENHIKEAAVALAARDLLHEQMSIAEAQIHKLAAKAGGPPPETAAALSDVGKQFNNIAGLATLPQNLMEHARSQKDSVTDLLGDISGNRGDAPDFETSDKSPMDLNFRQEMNNIDARTHLEHLLQDQYIRNHPIQDVVAAYNRAMSVNPNLGHAELAGLIKQDLAAGGAVPLDTLLRART